MHLPIEELTPRQIVAELDRYIVGQNAAKRAVAVALRNRYRRQQLPESEREDVMPKNILLIGPTGVGKTEIARRLAQLARAPFVKVEATKFTEVGYVGRDVESMIRDLAANAVRLVERERTEAIRNDVERRVLERLADMLYEEPPYPAESDEEPKFDAYGFPLARPYDEAFEKEREALRAKLIEEIQAGEHDDREVEVETEEASNPFLQVFTPGGMEEMGIDTNQINSPFGTRRSSRTATVAEAKSVLFEEEAKRLLDRGTMHREAIHRAEQTGIVFLDEIDKVAGKNGGSGPDVSREGVQRDLLPVIEGSTVATKFGPVRTDHILFIAAGAFHMSKPSDLIPELQGRLPIRVELESLSQDDFRRILLEPKNALTKQYVSLLAVEGVHVEFLPEALELIAKMAAQVNEQTQNIGARRLHTVMERLLGDILYEAPEGAEKNIVFDAARVERRLHGLVNDIAKSGAIL